MDQVTAAGTIAILTLGGMLVLPIIGIAAMLTSKEVG